MPHDPTVQRVAAQVGATLQLPAGAVVVQAAAPEFVTETNCAAIFGLDPTDDDERRKAARILRAIVARGDVPHSKVTGVIIVAVSDLREAIRGQGVKLPAPKSADPKPDGIDKDLEAAGFKRARRKAS